MDFLNQNLFFMETNDRNEWRSGQGLNRGDESTQSSSGGIRSNSDWRPDMSSSNRGGSSENSGRIGGATVNTTNAGSGAMIGSTSGSSRDYERNPAFNRNREGENYRDYGQGQGSRSSYPYQGPNYDYERSENQNRGQYGRSSNPYQQENRRGENRNYGQDYNQQYQGGGQERGYQGQHRTRHNQYAGGQGGHDYGQAPDWNQSHGSNWANQDRNRQEQQRGSQGSFGGYGESSGFSRTGTTPTYSNRFEDQNRYSGERQQNRNYEGLSRDRDYGSQSDRAYNKGHDYGPGSYAEELNRDYGQRMRRGSEGQNYGSGNRNERRGGAGRGISSGHESYGGRNDFTGGMYGSSNHGGGRYVGEGYERPRNYGGSTISGGGASGSSSYDRQRNRNYGAGSSSEQGSSYSGASSYGGGGNYGAGYGRNRTGTSDYGNPRESSRSRHEGDFYQNRNSQRNEQEDRGFIDKMGERVQSWFGGNESDRNR